MLHQQNPIRTIAWLVIAALLGSLAVIIALAALAGDAHSVRPHGFLFLSLAMGAMAISVKVNKHGKNR